LERTGGFDRGVKKPSEAVEWRHWGKEEMRVGRGSEAEWATVRQCEVRQFWNIESFESEDFVSDSSCVV
jgi:hypothetical protein